MSIPMTTKTLKSPNDYPAASIRMTAEMRKEFPGASPSAALRNALEYAVAARQDARRELAGVFTFSELRAIAGTLNGTFIDPAILPYLDIEIAEALGESGAGVAERVRGLSFMARWVLAETVTVVRPKTILEYVRAGVVPSEGV